MRLFLILVLVAAAALYLSIGLRLGLIPQTPMLLANAQGTNNYSIVSQGLNDSVTFSTDAALSGGAVDLALYGPAGRPIWSRHLPSGLPVHDALSVPLPQAAIYRLELSFQATTGRLGLGWRVASNP